MCFSDEAHIRVPTLRNHLLQNNAITKLFMDEARPGRASHELFLYVTYIV